MGAAHAEFNGRIILTGFSSFPGVAVNPSEHLVQWFHEQSRQALCGTGQLVEYPELAAVVCNVLPVSAADCDAYLQGLSSLLLAPGQDQPPILFIHLGVDRKAPRIRLERFAYNESTFRVPDVRGWQPQRACISGGEELGSRRETALDVPGVVKSLRVRGFDVDVSEDPGRYICNWLYYRSLGLAASLSGSSPKHAPAPAAPLSNVPPSHAHSSLLLSGALSSRPAPYRAGFMLTGSPAGGAVGWGTGQQLTSPASSPASLQHGHLTSSGPALQTGAQYISPPITSSGMHSMHNFMTSNPQPSVELRAVSGGSKLQHAYAAGPHSSGPPSAVSIVQSSGSAGNSGPPSGSANAPPAWLAQKQAPGLGHMPWDPRGHSSPGNPGSVGSSGNIGPRAPAAALFVHIPPFETVCEEVQRAFLINLMQALAHHFFAGTMPV